MTIATENFTLDDLLNLVHEDAAPGDLARLSAESRRDFSDHNYFLVKRGGRWGWPPDSMTDTPRGIVARNIDTTVRWSPLIYHSSPMENAPARLPLVWASLSLRIEPSRFDASLGSVNADSERAALARIAACSPQPNFVLHEGVRLTALWLLKEALPAPVEPIDESKAGPFTRGTDAQAQRLLWSIALRVGGDRRALDPRKALFQVPGTPMANVFPRREVTVVVNDAERRYAIEEL